MKKLHKGLAVLLCLIMMLSVSNVAMAGAVFAAETEVTDEVQGKSVTLNAGKGTFGDKTGPESKVVILGEDNKLPTNTPEPTRQGWTFAGWYTAPITENYWGDEQGETVSELKSRYSLTTTEARDKDFTWLIISGEKLVKNEDLLHDGDTVSSNVTTLYAVYKPTTLTVKWHYNENRTGVLTDTGKQYGSKLVRAEESTAFAWEGHTLLGWTTEDGTEWKFDTKITDEDGKVYYVSDNTVTENLDLYAKWSATEPDSITLTSKNGTGLVEPGTTVTVSATYSPSKADAPKLEWTVSDPTLAEVVSTDGLTCTVSIKSDAAVTDSNKIVTVKATSKNSSLSAETSITVGHNWKMTGWVDSTCNKAGAIHYKCTKHTDVTKDVPLDLASHSYNKGEVTKEPACEEEGTRTYTCIVCGNKYTESIPATGVHTWDEGIVTTEPTCVKTGVLTHSCTGCGETKAESIPATGQHDYKLTSSVVNQAATFVAVGSHTDIYTCTMCGSTKSETIVDPPIAIPQLGELAGQTEVTEDTQNIQVTLNAGKGTFGDANGPHTKSVDLGADRKLSDTKPDPTREGWEFAGWYTAEITENFWGDDQGETFKALQSKYSLSTEEARKKDFTWIIESNDKLVEDKDLLHDGDTVPSDVTALYAVYKPTMVTVTWHYHDDWMASDGKTQTGILTHNDKQYGSKLARAEATGVFAWEGHELLGWYTKDGQEWKFDTLITDDVNGDYYISNDVVTEDLDLYAKWSEIEPNSINLTSKNGIGLVEPGTTVMISATYSPSKADAPELTWEITDGSEMADLSEADNGLTRTLTIKNDADVTQNNKTVTVKATSKNNPALTATITITVGHDWKMAGWKDATCKEAGVTHYKCTKHTNVTKDVTSNLAAHSFDDGKVTKEATCVDTGVKTYTCTGCNKTKEEVIEATGKHQFKEVVTQNLGQKDHYNSCTVCGKQEFLYTEKGSFNDCTITLAASSYTYDGTAKKPTVTVKSGSTALKQDTDYTVSYSNNVNAGTAIVTVTGKGQYSGTNKKTFTIKKANNKITASNFTKTYSTKAQSFSIGAKRSGNAKLTYSSNNKSVTVNSSGKVTVKAKFIGKATITIKSAVTSGYNSASKKITVTVNPSKTTLSSVMNAKGKKMTVKWRKNSAVTGYQIQYSTNKNFKSGVNTKTVAKNGTVSKTFGSLTKGKKYYVRVRTYKTVSGTKYYSGWSSIKSVNISK